MSLDKSTYPDVKQIFRTYDTGGRLAGDVLGLRAEALPGERLLQPVLREGALIAPLPSLPQIRERAQAQREALPDSIRRLQDPEPLQLTISEGLRAVVAELDRAMGR
jgi:nicotinate phosphoribosyltransferase